MYELICPECGNVTRWTFVRVGAVRVCAECRYTFQIEKEHVRHRVRWGIATASFEEDQDNQTMPSVGMTHDDTALMGQPALVEEELTSEETDRGDTASSTIANPNASTQSMDATSAACTPGIVLWAGIALLGLGVLLLLLWLVGAGADPTRWEGIRPMSVPGNRSFNTTPPSKP